jgi:hypothetical protein
MFVCYECCVLSGRGLCVELITRPEHSYRLWRVIVCDLETSRIKNEEAMARVAPQRQIIHTHTHTYIYIYIYILTRLTYDEVSILTPHTVS